MATPSGYRIPVQSRLTAAEQHLASLEASLEECRRALNLPVVNGLIRIPGDRAAWNTLHGRRSPRLDLEARAISIEAEIVAAKRRVDRFRAEAEGAAA